MMVFSAFFTLAVVLALYAAYFRLAARILRASRIGWLYALQFAGLTLALSIGGRLLSAYAGVDLPLFLALSYGMAVHLALGSWFFRKRALASNGLPLGWMGGAKLSAIAYAFLLLTVAVLLGVLRALPSFLDR